jgi:hypothetical protein
MISGSSVDAVAPISSPCCWLSLPRAGGAERSEQLLAATTGCNQ